MSNFDIDGIIRATGGRGTTLLNAELVSSSGIYYIRFFSGLQIAWGTFTKSTNVTVTLPVAFVDTNYKVCCQHAKGTMRGNYTNTGDVSNKTTTTFQFDANHSEKDTYDYIAIGKWK